MKNICLSILLSFSFSFAFGQKIPTVSQVGAECVSSEIAPIEAPFDMPQMVRPTFPARSVNIRDCGAKPERMATVAIQKAIDRVSAKGGGTVFVPAGRWQTGRITLRSRVNLHLEAGAELSFSGNVADYQPAVFTRNEGIEMMTTGALIYAEDATDIAITGQGKLIGPGKDCELYAKQMKGMVVEKFVSAETPVSERVYDGNHGTPIFLPMFFAPINSRNVWVEGVTFENAIYWNIVPIYCDNVIIRGVTVSSTGGRTDGIDIESSRNVLIEYTTLGCGDDCFTIKSGRAEDGLRVNRPSENIVIRHCLALRGPGAMTCGSETAGMIRNVYMHDCVFEGTANGFYFKTRRNRGGGAENLYFERIRMSKPKRAFRFDMLGSKTYVGDLAARLPKRAMTRLTPLYRNISVRDVVVEQCEVLIDATGIPESPIEGLVVSGMDAHCRRAIRLSDVDGFVLANSTIQSANDTLWMTGCRNISLIDVKADLPGGRWQMIYQDDESRPVIVQ